MGNFPDPSSSLPYEARLLGRSRDGEFPREPNSRLGCVASTGNLYQSLVEEHWPSTTQAAPCFVDFIVFQPQLTIAFFSYFLVDNLGAPMPCI